MSKVKAVLLRRWPILVVALVIGLVAGAASASVGQNRDIAQYQADQVLVANRSTTSPPNVEQDALKVTRGEVPATAAAALGLPEREDFLARQIRTRSDTDAGSITITGYDTDPEVAAERVDAFAEAFLEVVNADLQSDQIDQLAELERRREFAVAELEGFDASNPLVLDPQLPSTPSNEILVTERARLAQAVTTAENDYNQFTLIVSRRLPYASLGPAQPFLADAQLVEVPDSPLFRAGLLGAIGLLLGVGLTVLVERANVRIDTREELADVVTVPIIAEVNRLTPRRQPRHHDGRVRLDGPWGEQYRRVKSAIQFSQAHFEGGHEEDTPRVFMFVSALPSEGKSTSVALTATALAQDGVDTVAINADFRVPRLDKMLGAVGDRSIADRAELSTTRATIDEVIEKTIEPNLSVVSSGPPTREVTRRVQAAAEVATTLSDRGTLVLIDSTPLQVANDTVDLLPVTDHVVIVARAGRTTRRALTDAMNALKQHDADILGAILVGTLEARESKAYYGSYYDTLGPRSLRQELTEAVGSGADDGADDTQTPVHEVPDGRRSRFRR